MTKAKSSSPPLLLFDSGIGGLSVLAKVRALLPAAPIVYAADYAGLPYGTKSEAEVQARVPVLLGRLAERYQPQLITIACNTASTIALDHVRSALDIPIVGTVPAIKPAALASRTGVIGLLGTQATIRQPYIDRLIRDHGPDTIMLRHGAPDLVHAAEAKLRGEAVDAAIFAEAMAGLRHQANGMAMDQVVLACTHFPLVQAELRAVTGDAVDFVDGSDGIARRMAFLRQSADWSAKKPEDVFVTTGPLEQLDPLRAALRSYGFDRFEKL